jgi:hypothetical protein
MSDRMLLEDLLLFIEKDAKERYCGILAEIWKKAKEIRQQLATQPIHSCKTDEIRTSMAIARPTDDRFEECCYAQKKCELNNTDQDGDPFCTVCIRCPNYRVIREERKDCNTCKYEYIKRFDLPCLECYITRDGSFPKWQPQERSP